MEKIVVISTNDNPGYKFYVPITCWAWKKFGWKTALFITHDVEDIEDFGLVDYKYKIPNVDNVRTGTLAQVGRHFSSNYLPKDAYILLSDIDMVPLADYIQPVYGEQTVWGHDLTGYSFIPVSYIGMTGGQWYDLMGCTGDMEADMRREMVANGRAYKENWEEYWDADWEILTHKVMAFKEKFKFIDRGFVNLAEVSTARGRADRYGMDKTMEQELIDCHGENVNPSHPDKYNKLRKVLLKAFGEIPVWLENYATNHYNKFGI